MRLLLDTHILLWALNDDSKLSGKARKLIENAAKFTSVRQHFGKWQSRLAWESSLWTWIKFANTAWKVASSNYPSTWSMPLPSGILNIITRIPSID